MKKFLGGTASTDVASGKDVTVKNKMYNLVISVGDVQRGVNYSNAGTLSSSFGLNGTYTKVKVTIKNNSSTEANLNSYLVPINLLDSNKNKINYCSYGSSVQDDSLANEKLSDTIAGNSSISGYVYCKTDSTAGAILNINIPKSANTTATGGYDVDLDEYYFKLN